MALAVCAGFVVGVLVGAAAVITVAVWLALRAHSRQETARVLAEMHMADVQAKAAQIGRLVEPPRPSVRH